jgi:hypothetical protein
MVVLATAPVLVLVALHKAVAFELAPLKRRFANGALCPCRDRNWCEHRHLVSNTLSHKLSPEIFKSVNILWGVAYNGGTSPGVGVWSLRGT